MTDHLEFHPLAELFPMIEGAEFGGLVEDIKANGLRQPICLHEGKILDGRNRYLACEAAGVQPRFEPFPNSGDRLRVRGLGQPAPPPPDRQAAGGDRRGPRDGRARRRPTEAEKAVRTGQNGPIEITTAKAANLGVAPE